MPLGANTQGANAVNVKPLAQPCPSPGTGIPVIGDGFVPPAGVAGWKPVLVAPTANSLSCKIASGRFHFRLVKEGVVIQGPNCSLPDTCPPRAYESWDGRPAFPLASL